MAGEIRVAIREVLPTRVVGILASGTTGWASEGYGATLRDTNSPSRRQGPREGDGVKGRHLCRTKEDGPLATIENKS